MNLKIQWVVDKLAHCHANKCSALNLRFSYIREIPESLSKCNHVQHLNLSNNYIQELPKYLEDFKQLQYIDLRYNPLTIELPYLKGLFIHSKHLKLVANKKGVDGLRCGPPELKNIQLPNLKYLDCSSQNLSLINCTNFSDSIKNSLQELDISNNPITEIIGLETLPNLQKIVAKNTTFALEHSKIQVSYE